MLYCYDMFNSRMRIKEKMFRNQTAKSTKPMATATCFICSQSFPRADLSAHEKACLQNIQCNDVQFTRQNTEVYSVNDSSNHSSGNSSSESYEKKFHRCYICGTDVSSYLMSIHEKNCKKNWENGLLNSIATPARGNVLKGSKGDLSTINAGLTKSRSTSHLTNGLKLSTSNGNLANGIARKAALSEWRREKSKSSMNLRKSPESKPLKQFSFSKATSSQDIQRASSCSEGSPRKATPQYVECHTCGKQYSTHSIEIHRKQCIRTRNIQADTGLVPTYKKKSRSMADISLGRSPARPSSSSMQKTPLDSPVRPATACGDRTLSGKQSPHAVPNGNPFFTPQKSRDQNITASLAGFQECPICTQIYGSRSLPIHEKQCRKKMELAKLAETKQNKISKRNKDIKVVPFGRSRDNVSAAKDNNEVQKLFYDDAEIKRDQLKLHTCLYCKRTYGEHSIKMHERTCREKQQKENVPKTIASTLSKSLGDIRQLRANSDALLVTCEDCSRKFLSTDIARHQQHCKIVI